MNFVFQLCPKCNKHTKVFLDKDNVHIICSCNNNSAMKINHFCAQFNHHKSNSLNNDNTFSNIITDINKGYQHLSTYFMELKKDYISHLLNIINTIETSYEESYKRNKNILSFLQILIDNYDGSIERKRI